LYLNEYSKKPPKKLPFESATFYLFRLMLFPILMTLLVGLDITIWTLKDINYVFIFHLDPRRHISKWKLFEISLLLYFLWIITLDIYIWSAIVQKHFDQWLFPIILFSVYIMWFISPLPIFERTSRYWLIKKLL